MNRTAAATIFSLMASVGPTVLSGQETARATAAAPVRREIVVTNQGVALLTETRRVDLPRGTVELFWDGAPPTARTETWSVTGGEAAGVRWLGLTSPLVGEEGNWLEGLAGRRVRVERPDGSRTEADVLAVHGTTPETVLFREGDELVYGEPGARLVLPGGPDPIRRPEGIHLKIESAREGARELTSRYLAGGLGWEAHYALDLAADEKSARLEGWFSVENRSGADLSAVRLRLLAGELRVTQPPPTPMAYRAERMVVAQDVAILSEPASESRLYEIPSPGRIGAGRSTFPLVAPSPVGVEKRYLVRSNAWPGEAGEPQRLPVSVVYSVAAAKLALALPAGIVRVFSAGGTLFTGEDRIGHTPEKTDFEIETSTAFDLSARRRTVEFRQTSPQESETSYEVILASRKKESVTVLVRETFPGDWTILESSLPGRRLSGSVAEFAVPVPPGGEVKLTFRVRVRTRG